VIRGGSYALTAERAVPHIAGHASHLPMTTLSGFSWCRRPPPHRQPTEIAAGVLNQMAAPSYRHNLLGSKRAVNQGRLAEPLAYERRLA
jgi:hypothetical protein